jgi:hypothetical protein
VQMLKLLHQHPLNLILRDEVRHGFLAARQQSRRDCVPQPRVVSTLGNRENERNPKGVVS